MAWFEMACTFLGSSVVCLVLQRIWTKKDRKDSSINEIRDMVSSIKDSVDDISERLEAHIKLDDERDAIQCRTRIQRFNDELLHGVQHTKEHFDSVLLDCTRYNRYCEEHKGFANSVTQAAEAHIKSTYDECLSKRNFL